jgi:hypothetical protein
VGNMNMCGGVEVSRGLFDTVHRPGLYSVIQGKYFMLLCNIGLMAVD